MAKFAQVNLKLSRRDVDRLARVGVYGKGGAKTTEVVRQLMADGLRWRLQHRVQKSLDTFLLLIQPDARMLDLWEKNQDALYCESNTSIIGPLGSRYRFEEVPQPAHADGDSGPRYWPLRDDEDFKRKPDGTLDWPPIVLLDVDNREAGAADA